MYIVIDGPDFSGKSTQVKLLKESLLKEVQSEDHLLVVREPGGTGNAEAIRNLLLDDSLKTPLAETELLLFVSARYELHQTVIKPFIEKMKEEKVEKWFIISDRSLISSWAYQCHTKKLEEYFDLLHGEGSPVIKPDVAFALIPSLEEIKSRMEKSKYGLDRMESKGEEYLKTTLERYVGVFDDVRGKFLSGKVLHKVLTLDADQSEEFLGDLIYRFTLNKPRPRRMKKEYTFNPHNFATKFKEYYS